MRIKFLLISAIISNLGYSVVGQQELGPVLGAPIGQQELGPVLGATIGQQELGPVLGATIGQQELGPVLGAPIGQQELGKHIFCYYSSFAYKRHSVGNFVPEDINPYLCTHIIYAFVEITKDGTDLKPANPNDLGPDGLYARTMALKEKNPSLKILIAVGGWNIGSEPFVPMIQDESTRNTWIQNVVKYVRKHGFDGFDMDWEFPATRGSPPEDKYRFTLLMKGLYEAFAEEAKETGKEKLLLTIAAASGTYYIDQSYEPSKIINYIDFMFLMTYNYHGQWEKWTGHHSGLYPHKNDPKTGEKAQLYQEWSIDYWLNVGISKDKLVVGIPTYGMTFTLADPADNGVRAPICANLKDGGWKSEWIDEQSVPYAYGGDLWAGYEDRKSISIKAKNILKRDLAGAFVWSVEMDDFGGVCGEGHYPLLSTITESIGGSSVARAAAGHPEFRPEQRPRPSAPLEDPKSATVKVVSWKKGKKMTTAHIEKKTNAAITTPPSVEELGSTTLGQEKLKVRPWTQPKKTSKWRPLPMKKESTGLPLTTQATQASKKMRYLWRKKFVRHQNSAQIKRKENDETTSLQTTKWWSTSPSHKLSESHESSSEQESSEDVNKVPQQRQKTHAVRTQHNHMDEPKSHPAAASSHHSSSESSDEETDERQAVCRDKGIGTYADPFSCDHFIICMSGSWSDIPPHVMSCPPGTKFDEQLKICNYAFNVHCHH
ncbi:hypothetical protein Btru_061747 [Bulinus truncatus]|nr:hypothetical protein Btru_061747 [Bulinus truncatus]